MTIKLFDYCANVVEVNVGDIETIGSMHIDVITGDEVLTVIRKVFTVEKFDSCNSRLVDYPDWAYVIYDSDTGVNLLENEIFINRTKSYWFF